jgi:hypothetical protein
VDDDDKSDVDDEEIEALAAAGQAEGEATTNGAGGAAGKGEGDETQKPKTVRMSVLGGSECEGVCVLPLGGCGCDRPHAANTSAPVLFTHC